MVLGFLHIYDLRLPAGVVNSYSNKILKLCANISKLILCQLCGCCHRFFCWLLILGIGETACIEIGQMNYQNFDEAITVQYGIVIKSGLTFPFTPQVTYRLVLNLPSSSIHGKVESLTSTK